MESYADRYRRLIQQVELFQGLTPDDIEKIFARGMTMRLSKGDTVFHKGTVGNQMFVVLGGKVGVYDGNELLSELGTGAPVGELSLLTNEPRSATVRALEDCMLFVLSDDTFDKLLTKRVSVQMLLNLSRILGQRIVRMNAKLRELEDR